MYNTASVKYDEGLRAFMLSVFNNMGLGVLLSTVIAWYLSSSPEFIAAATTSFLGWVLILAPLVVSLGFIFLVDRVSPAVARIWFYAYAALMGASLSLLFAVYTGESVVQALLSSAVMFGAMSLYGYTTKRDLTNFGSFLIMGLIGIIVVSIINIFLASSMLAFLISVIAVIVFAGLTAYDVQKLKEVYYSASSQEEAERMGIVGAFTLYLDFINLFIHLLQLLGTKRD